MADSPIVKPAPISGFPEWLPAEKLVEERFLTVIRTNFRRFGFAPIETPAIERRNILTAKGIVDKEIYALSRLAAGPDEDPATDLALHFDLTVPTARYVAQHLNRLTFPFRRYQIQKVWRGERPQAGRFREFYQCDIDIIGNGTLDLLADAEVPAVIHAVFRELEIGRFLIRINNRKVLQGLLADLGVTDQGVPAALRAIDGLEKVGHDAVAAELAREAGMAPAGADRLLAALAGPADLDRLLADASSPVLRDGIAELGQVVGGMAALGVPADAYTVDLSIARGLDYYTGTVYETQLVDLPDIGSVCSGGRYDDLASNYTRQKLPGVGISIGLTRMLARLFEAGTIAVGPSTPASVLITVMDRDALGHALAMATELRSAGIDTELYTEPRKFAAQLKYADAKGFRLAVIAGESERTDGAVLLKDLATGQQTRHPRADLTDAVRRALATAERPNGN